VDSHGQVLKVYSQPSPTHHRKVCTSNLFADSLIIFCLTAFSEYETILTREEPHPAPNQRGFFIFSPNLEPLVVRSARASHSNVR
jgi:hypothetical protein